MQNWIMQNYCVCFFKKIKQDYTTSSQVWGKNVSWSRNHSVPTSSPCLCSTARIKSNEMTKAPVLWPWDAADLPTLRRECLGDCLFCPGSKALLSWTLSWLSSQNPENWNLQRLLEPHCYRFPIGSWHPQNYDGWSPHLGRDDDYQIV